MSAHTPGPWKVSAPQAMYGFEVLAGEKNARLICQMTPYVSRYPDSPANACLIAAAPAMLEALEIAEKCIASLPHSWGVDIAELPRIRAALRAAKGETNG